MVKGNHQHTRKQDSRESAGKRIESDPRKPCYQAENTEDVQYRYEEETRDIKVLRQREKESERTSGMEVYSLDYSLYLFIYFLTIHFKTQ